MREHDSRGRGHDCDTHPRTMKCPTDMPNDAVSTHVPRRRCANQHTMVQAKTAILSSIRGAIWGVIKNSALSTKVGACVARWVHVGSNADYLAIKLTTTEDIASVVHRLRICSTPLRPFFE